MAEQSKQIAFRVPADLSAALDARRREDDATLSRTIIALLEEALGWCQPTPSERLDAVEEQLALLREGLAARVSQIEANVTALQTSVQQWAAHYDDHFGALAIVVTAGGGSYSCHLRVIMGKGVESSHGELFPESPDLAPATVWLVNPSATRERYIRDALSERGVAVQTLSLYPGKPKAPAASAQSESQLPVQRVRVKMTPPKRSGLRGDVG